MAKATNQRKHQHKQPAVNGLGLLQLLDSMGVRVSYVEAKILGPFNGCLVHPEERVVMMKAGMPQARREHLLLWALSQIGLAQAVA